MAKLKTLEEFFFKELGDLFDAEQQIGRAFPKVVEAATAPDLKAALEQHLEETRCHVERLGQIFEMIQKRPDCSQCAGVAALIVDVNDIMDEAADRALADAAIIATAQKVEHYEICGYGTVRAYAELLGYDEAAVLLAKTLEEEKAADQKLSQLAEASVNLRAVLPDQPPEHQVVLAAASVKTKE